MSSTARINSRKSTLGGDAVRLTASKVITLCITMVTTMMLSRIRTYDEYGTYSQMLLVTSLFTTMLMLGLPNSLNYFLARAETREEKGKFMSVYYTLSTILSAVIGLVLVLAVPLITAYFHNPSIAGFVYFLALYPWANIISASIENVLVVFKQTRFLMAYRIVHSLALLGSVMVVQWLGYGFSTYIAAFVGVNCFFAITVYIIASYLGGGIRPSLDRAMIRAIFAFSIPMGLAAVVGTLNTELDKLMIGFLLDTEQMAIYTNAAKELPLTIVSASVTAVLLPQLTLMIKHGKSRAAIGLWADATELSFIIIALFVAGMFTFADEVIAILYSAKYLPGIHVFRVYTLNLLFRCTYFGMVLNAYGQSKKIFYCSLASLGLNVILNPLMYFMLGMVGPAVATLIAIAAVMLLQLRMTSKTTEIPFSQVFPWKRLGKVLLVNIVFAGFFWGIKRVLPLEMLIGGGSVGGEVIESLILGAVWSVLYLAVMKKRLVFSWRELNKGGEA